MSLLMLSCGKLGASLQVHASGCHWDLRELAWTGASSRSYGLGEHSVPEFRAAGHRQECGEL